MLIAHGRLLLVAWHPSHTNQSGSKAQRQRKERRARTRSLPPQSAMIDESSCGFNKRREQDECAGGTGSSAIASWSVREKAAEAGTTQTGSITDRNEAQRQSKAPQASTFSAPTAQQTLPPPRISAVQILTSSNLSRPMCPRPGPGGLFTTRPNLPPQASCPCLDNLHGAIRPG